MFSINPLSKGMSNSALGGLALYLLFMATSVWATAESIRRTTSLPLLYCYVISFGVFMSASLCLALVHRSVSNSYQSSRISLLLTGILSFILLWTVCFAGNVHNFYYISVIDEVQRRELGEVYEKLVLLREKKNIGLRSAKDALQTQVETEVERMKSEIMNPGNPGAGERTELILGKIERLLQSPIQRISAPPGGFAARRAYSIALASQIDRMLDLHLAEMDRAASSVDTFLLSAEYSEKLGQLKAILDSGISQKSIESRDELIQSAFELYNRGTKLARDTFRASELLKLKADIFPELPDSPQSLRIRSIATAWRDFLAGSFEASKFWLAVLWALALDVGAFIILYYFVFKDDDEY